MKVSNAFQCTIGATALLSPASAVRTNAKQQQRQQQQHISLQEEEPIPSIEQESIVSYTPLTQVTDAAALDQDQALLEWMVSAKTTASMDDALAMYTRGASSKSFALLTLNNTTNYEIKEGTLVMGLDLEGNEEVVGTLIDAVNPGDTTIKVEYDTQQTQLNCRVGASPDPALEGCFAPEGTLTVGRSVGDPENLMTLSFDYTYDPLTSNQNARTLQSLSTNAQASMYECDNCPYNTFQKFYNYYGAFNYGDEWVMSAFERNATQFANGNADFSAYVDDDDIDGVVEAIRKGTVYLNVFMEVVRSMESALDDCQAGCEFGGCNDDLKANAWDEAVAFYVGSAGEPAGEQGTFLYTNANKRCSNFGTCDDGSGNAKANTAIMEEFRLGQAYLLNGQCGTAKQSMDKIVPLLAAPLIQGTLRFAYMMGKDGIDEARADATGATYAASVLPFVHDCSPVDAQIIYSSMRVGSLPDFDEVKAAFERTYTCMGLTCAEIGGVVGSGEYLEGAEPCVDAGSFDTGATAMETESETETTSITNGVEVPADSAPACPPCSDTIQNPAFSEARRNMECPMLVADQSNLRALDCQCSCFVDSIFSFCAQAGIAYTGEGSLVGPCEMIRPTTTNEVSEEDAPAEKDDEDDNDETDKGDDEADKIEETVDLTRFNMTTPVENSTMGESSTFTSAPFVEEEEGVTEDVTNINTEQQQPIVSLVEGTSSAATSFLFGSCIATVVSLAAMM